LLIRLFLYIAHPFSESFFQFLGVKQCKYPLQRIMGWYSAFQSQSKCFPIPVFLCSGKICNIVSPFAPCYYSTYHHHDDFKEWVPYLGCLPRVSQFLKMLLQHIFHLKAFFDIPLLYSFWSYFCNNFFTHAVALLPRLPFVGELLP